MAQVVNDLLYANVSATVSAGDGVTYDLLTAQPPSLPTPPFAFTGGAGVSCPAIDMLEFMRRTMTHITSPSATIVSGTAAGAVAVTLGTVGPSGITGMMQGYPFALSAAGTLSAALGASAATTSQQIRKVLVTLALSSFPIGGSGLSGFALAGGVVQFVYGSAMTTSAMACTSGSQAYSYWDYVPLPLASAQEVPVGWINVANSCTAAQATINSCMFTDYRVTQGLNMSAMLQGRAQP